MAFIGKIKMDDKQIISLLGGPSKVSDLLGYPKKTGPQRVWNWTVRGIPAQVKLDYFELFKQKNRISDRYGETLEDARNDN